MTALGQDMYALFTQTQSPVGGVSKPAQFEWLQRCYLSEIEKIKQYYNTRVFSLPNQHILVRALTTAIVPQQYDIDRYVEVALSRSPYVCKHFKFTSEINAGTPHSNCFYGGVVEEYVLAHEGYINPFQESPIWDDVPAVSVLQHPVSDLSLSLPTGSAYGNMAGTSVVTLDLPRLLLQYRTFCKEQAKKIDQGSEQTLGPSHFIHQKILPQLLETHLDYVWMNRLMNRFYGAPNSLPYKKLPFAVLAYESKMDELADQVLKQITDSKSWYTHTLQSIPSFYKKDMLESLQMPDLALTGQVWWLVFLTRLPVMKFLLDVGGPNGIRSNRGYVNQLQIALKRLLSQGIPNGAMSTNTKFDFEYEANEILKL